MNPSDHGLSQKKPVGTVGDLVTRCNKKKKVKKNVNGWSGVQ